MEELKEMQEGQEELTRLHEVHSGLQEITAIARSALDSHEPITESTVNVIRCVAEQQVAKLGGEFEIRAVSTESLGSAREYLELSLESISETANKVWEAIKAAIKKLGEWLGKIFGLMGDKDQDNKEQAEKTLAALKSHPERFSAEPPKADKPQFPYGDLPNSMVIKIMMDGKIDRNWYTTVPKALADYYVWVEDTVKKVTAKETELVGLWEKTLQHEPRDWSAFDKALIAAVNEYDTWYANEPKLHGRGGFKRREGIKKATTLDDVKRRSVAFGVDSEANYYGEKLGQKLPLASQGQLVVALSALAEMSGKTGPEAAAQAAKKYQQDVDQKFHLAMNSRTRKEGGDLVDASLDWEAARDRIRLISGDEVRRLVRGWDESMTMVRGVINLIQTIAKIHLV